MKKYFYIILGIIVLAAVAIGILLLFKKQSLPAAVSGLFESLPNAGTQTIGSSTAGNQAGGGGASSSSPSSNASGTPSVAMLSHNPVLAYFASANDNVIAVHPDGTIEAIANGQSTNLNSSAISNIISADFSYDGEKILIRSGDPAGPQWSIFDVATKTLGPLPVNPDVAAWSPSGYQLAYFATVNGVSALETIDLAAKNPQPKFIAAFPGEDFTLVWNSPNDVLLEDRPSALFSGSILDVNLTTAAVSTVVINKVGLDAQWNPGGTMAVILVGTPLARGGQLGIIDNSGTLLHQLTFLTLPSKCVFPAAPPATATNTIAAASSTSTTTKGEKATATTSVVAGAATSTTTPPVAASTTSVFSSFGLICAVPTNKDALNNNPLPDAYNERLILTSDYIYSIDLANGNTSPLFTDSTQNFDVSDITLSSDAIYFINRYDQKLYSLTLAQ